LRGGLEDFDNMRTTTSSGTSFFTVKKGVSAAAIGGALIAWDPAEIIHRIPEKSEASQEAKQDNEDADEDYNENYEPAIERGDYDEAARL